MKLLRTQQQLSGRAAEVQTPWGQHCSLGELVGIASPAGITYGRILSCDSDSVEVRLGG